MATTEDSKSMPRKKSKIFLWIFLGISGFFALIAIFLVIVNVYVNSSGSIPAELRADPPQFAAMNTNPVTRPSPIIFVPSTESTLLKMAEAARQDPAIDIVYQIDRLELEFERLVRFRRSGLTPAQIAWLDAHAKEMRSMHDLIRSTDPQKQAAMFVRMVNFENRGFLWVGYDGSGRAA